MHRIIRGGAREVNAARDQSAVAVPPIGGSYTVYAEAPNGTANPIAIQQRDDRCRLPPLQSCIVSVREYQLHKNAPRPVS